MPRSADAAPRSLTVALGELAAAMAERYDEEAFFRGLLRACGASTLLLTQALAAAGNAGDRSVSHEDNPALSHPDLAVPRWAYLRFVTDDTQVLPQGEALLSLPCVQDERNDYRCLLCVSPGQLGLIQREDDEPPERLFFPLSDLPAHYVALSRIDPGTRRKVRRHAAAGRERAADAGACRRLNVLLEDLLSANDHLGEHELRGLHRFVCRILFCLFAEDNGLFDGGQFVSAVRSHVGRDGAGAEQFFEELFAVLAMPENERSRLPPDFPAPLRAFPYVDGGLFEGECLYPRFDTAAYNQLMACCDLRWHQVSPAVFGAMFQNAMDPAARRQEGSHYTSEADILRVIRPLFLDELRAELDRILAMAPARRRVQLERFQLRLAELKFLDPACGCGNFLLVTYRELRRLENQILLALQELRGGQSEISVSLRQRISIGQFHGIELEHWPVAIAHVSMHLMEHALHQETNAALGWTMPSLPLGHSDAIVCANALLLDWNEVLPADQCSFVIGTPPFAGVTTTNDEQKAWLRACYPDNYKVGHADYCTAWFIRAGEYMSGNHGLTAAFIANRSICQGAQVPVLWELLLRRGIHLHFAWHSFPWRNETLRTALTAVIVGFGTRPPHPRARLFTAAAGGEVRVQEGPALTPYLTLGQCAGVIVRPARQALSAPLPIMSGHAPADGGHLIVEYEEGRRLLEERPEIRPFIRRYVSAEDVMAGSHRYCLWLGEEDRPAWEQIPEIARRVEACRQWRERQAPGSAAHRARKVPWRFKHLSGAPVPAEALVVPRTISEHRPLIFVDEHCIVNNRFFIIPGADEAHFAVLSSRMHLCWIRLTAARFGTGYTYSNDLVYNTFIWPQLSEAQHQELWDLGNAVLMRREHYYQRALGELYSELPSDLREMHRAIDEYVERLYRSKPFEDDEERTGWLLDLYAQAVAGQTKA